MKIELRRIRHPSWFLFFVLLCTAGFAGCNSKSMVPVRGKVTYKDGTVPAGGVAVVNFTPADDSTAQVRKGATGSINSDGSFEMMTRMPGDGVYPGSYNVAFVVQRSAMDATTSQILPKYNNPKTSGYTVTIDAAKSDLSFEIEPKAGSGAASAGAKANPGT